MKIKWLFLLAFVLALPIFLSTQPAGAQGTSSVEGIGVAPPPQPIYTKVNLTEPYDTIEGFTIYPSFISADLFYYVPKPRVATTVDGKPVFRLISYAMAENRLQVGSADVAGGYVQFDVTMSPTEEQVQKIKEEIINPPKRFKNVNVQGLHYINPVAKSIHPYNQMWGLDAKPKLQSVRLVPIPLQGLQAKAKIPGVLADDEKETEWYAANGDASGTTTFAVNLSGPQSIALYKAIMEPSIVEPLNVYFTGTMGGYIKCNAKLYVKTSEFYSFMQTQAGSVTEREQSGSYGTRVAFWTFGAQASTKSKTETQFNNIDATHIFDTCIRIEGDLQGYDTVMLALAQTVVENSIKKWGKTMPLDELMDPKKQLEDPGLPPNAEKPSAWAYVASAWLTNGWAGPGNQNPGRVGYYGFHDEKTLNQFNSETYTLDLNKQIAVAFDFAPSSSIFGDNIVAEIKKNPNMYAQKMALNDPFFEKIEITYGANLDFMHGPFNKVAYTDIFKLRDGTGYSIAGLLLETSDKLDPSGELIGVVPPQNLRFAGLLQGNLYQGDMGGAFNILNVAQTSSALSKNQWPTFEDGSAVKGITHRWKYTVYFRPSVRDSDFPPSWTSPDSTNSETVLMATIPPVVAVFVVSADALRQDRVAAGLLKVRYMPSTGGTPTVKTVKIIPGDPDQMIYFYDENPLTNMPCEYQYTLHYATGEESYNSAWVSDEGGMLLPWDPKEFEAAATGETVESTNEDIFSWYD